MIFDLLLTTKTDKSVITEEQFDHSLTVAIDLCQVRSIQNKSKITVHSCQC